MESEGGGKGEEGVRRVRGACEVVREKRWG